MQGRGRSAPQSESDSVVTDTKRKESKEPVAFYTYNDVAKRWKCSMSTVRRRVAAGFLETVGTGALTRIPVESVHAYEASLRRRRKEDSR